ncbi:LacI family DNA-binding transcriptional regulator [Paenibacillus sp. LMG 31458]|uniref:LacI family DNA-binding transcriptional regulator n=1 Tax=Paenibacillus phytorum TaxID=2654977 RepID=A0ABX1XX12_9BACL|nr:LacI family DNA-binding transcriptional regulator [Paenibacillus phytorum]NOU73082.1 LacI family DNA-binding transcriptional regulator [Paenibacillus phytorum]
MKSKITITEIAQKSGVSVSTVSRVLNNSPSVSQKKRERIQQVIDEYNYTPSVFARGMINQTTKNIGVILPDITNPYFASLFLQIESFALKHMYATLMFNTMFSRDSKRFDTHLSEEDYFKIILEKQVDGVLILGGQIDKEDIPDSFILALNQLRRHVPVVIVGSRIEGCECLFVERNLKQGVTSIVNHFIALGHDRIGFIGGEPGIRVTSSRIEAFSQAMKSLGQTVYDPYIVTSDYYAPDGYAAMIQLLDATSDRLPSAVIAHNDMVALGAVRAMKDRGLHCPEQIAIASCDQFPLSEYSIPRLTSMDQHNEYLGRMAVLQLISAINGSDETITINHSPELVVRESCGATFKSR